MSLTETERRILGLLPPWRHPNVAQAWTDHETQAGGQSIEHYTLDELHGRAAQDPQLHAGHDELEETLEDLRSRGLVDGSETGPYAQSKAGTDEITDGNAETHSRKVADALGAQLS